MNPDATSRRTSGLSLMNGWPMLGAVTTALALMAVIVAAMMPGVDGIRLIIRITARTSFVLFVMAFSASALWYFLPGRLTRWLRFNRRYLGLSFAISHTLHAVAILALAIADPQLFGQLTNIVTISTGLLAYGFIIAMAVTSFDRTAAAIGRRAWVTLHTVGGWYIWISFLVAFGKRALTSGFHQPFAVFLIAILVLKIAASSAKLLAKNRTGAAKLF